ncbi:MAG: ABC transporter permease [Actinomycetota bacterium]|nr:ABC transporter permease [Actinomycetota bacterium]
MTKREERRSTAGARLGMGASIRELFQARELTANLVRRDLKVRHRGTFLGMTWSLTTPLLIVALYYLVFKYILQASPAKDVARPDGHAVPFALYFFAGLTVWNLFATSVSASTSSIVGSGYLLRKVYFPRAILPLSAVLSSLVTFGFEVAVLMVAIVIAVGSPNFELLWVPVIVLIVTLMSYGLALFLSAVTVFLRDMAHFIGILLQLWFWGTPIIYSLQYVANREGVVRLLKLNPMTGIVVSFRNVTLLNRPPDLKLLALDAAYAVVFVVIGALVFRRSQRLFSEIV